MRADILAALVFSVFRSAPPTVCLLHLLQLVDSTQGSNALGFFLGQRFTELQASGPYDPAPQDTLHMPQETP
jgi:hypothetical protein